MQLTKNKCYTKDMPNFDIFDSNEFQSAFKNQTVYVAKAAAAEYNVEWDQVFNLLDADIKAGEPCGKKRLTDGGYRVLNALRIPVILEANNKLLEFFEPSDMENIVTGRSAHLYINITTVEGSYGVKHIDDGENVIFWNAKGVCKWTIYEKPLFLNGTGIPDTEIDVEVILEPGDMIFCPSDRPHKIEPLTPRFGISLGFGKVI